VERPARSVMVARCGLRSRWYSCPQLRRRAAPGCVMMLSELPARKNDLASGEAAIRIISMRGVLTSRATGRTIEMDVGQVIILSEGLIRDWTVF
jgi:hypothetical protein